MELAISALQVIRACLQAASALHAKQLVHSDSRFSNNLWDAEGPFVIDVQMGAKPPLKVRHGLFFLALTRDMVQQPCAELAWCL